MPFVLPHHLSVVYLTSAVERFRSSSASRLLQRMTDKQLQQRRAGEAGPAATRSSSGSARRCRRVHSRRPVIGRAKLRHVVVAWLRPPADSDTIESSPSPVGSRSDPPRPAPSASLRFPLAPLGPLVPAVDPEDQVHAPKDRPRNLSLLPFVAGH